MFSIWCFCARRVATHEVGVQTEGVAASGAGLQPLARRHQPRAEGRQWYVVFGVPAGEEDLLGLHFCYWDELVPELPGRRLVGSGIRDCKRFATGLEASEYFWRRVDHRLFLGFGEATPVHFYG